jgi:hypothetical protein
MGRQLTQPRAAMRVLAMVLLATFIPPAASQPPDPAMIGDMVGPVTDPVVAQAVPAAETAVDEDLHSEDIRVDVILDARNVEFQLAAMILGGGKVQADVTASVHLEFYAVSTERLDAAVKAASGDADASLNRTFGIPTNRTALTSEEIRLVGGGALLEAFQSAEVENARAFLQETVPEMTVFGLDVVWSNTAPIGWFPQPPALPPTAPSIPEVNVPDPQTVSIADPVPPLREPPIVLDAVARVQYLTRLSVVSLVQSALARSDGSDEKTPAQLLKADLIETQYDPPLERSAFELLGFSQLLKMSVPPGWTLNLLFLVPPGFTVEATTDELRIVEVDDGAAYYLDGSTRTEAGDQAGLLTISARGPVTLTLLVVAAIVGIALRLLSELGFVAVARVRHKRANA